MSKQTELIGYVNAMQTIIDNFPYSLLSLLKGKKYNSVFEFLLDILMSIPWRLPNGEQKDIPALIDMLLERLVGMSTESMQKISEGLANNNDLNNLDNVKFLLDIEDACKLAIASVLTALLSCSAIPEIPDKYMDLLESEYDSKGNKLDGGKSVSKLTGGYLAIPTNSIDFSGKLQIDPCHKIGKSFYDTRLIENGVLVSGACLSQNELYRTMDLDAFLWYVLNVGSNISQIETNKMVWDNRFNVSKHGGEVRAVEKDDEHPEQNSWPHWLESKTGDTGEFKNAFADTGSTELDVYKDVKTLLSPIMQLKPTGSGVFVALSAQKYYNRKKAYLDPSSPSRAEAVKESLFFNHTMFKFNWDYMRSIRIFTPSVIITNLYNSFANNLLTLGASSSLNLGLNINIQGMYEKVCDAVKKMIMADDMEVNDCYFTFSNEDFDEMLQKNELMKYDIQTYNAENGIASTYSSDLISEMTNPDATAQSTTTTVKKTLYDVTASPYTGTTVSTGLEVTGLNQVQSLFYQLLYSLVMSIINPIISCLLAPKVIMIFMINFAVIGLINLDDLRSGNINALMSLVYKKLLAIIKTIILFIKDKIIEILIDLVLYYIKPIIDSFAIIILQEILEDWIKFLEECLKCIPVFNLNLAKLKYTIDNVNYADIETSQDTPESTDNC